MMFIAFSFLVNESPVIERGNICDIVTILGCFAEPGQSGPAGVV